jgi:type IV pilus assembly protein PilQ
MKKQWGIIKIGSLFQAWQFTVSLIGLSLLVFAGSAHAVQINSVDYSTLPGDKVQLRFGFDGIPPEPRGYNIEKPARIALDLDGVSSSLSSKYHELGLGNARNLTVIEAGKRTRLIISLTQLEEYKTEIRDNSLYVTIGDGVGVGEAESAKAATATSTGNATSFAGKSNRVKSVDFQRGVEGEGKVIIKLSDPHTQVNMKKEGDTIRVKFSNIKLPDDLVRRLDVIDFATPVKEIDATNESDGALIVIKPHGEYEHLAYQTDDTYIVSVKPLSAKAAERKKKKAFSYTGEKLSLNFQDIEVRAVLQLIADFTELNLVASDTVGGKITLRLQNVPWDQALDLILKTKGLDKRKIGNVMLVAPADEIAAREKLELEANRQVAALAPMQSEFFTIKYAAAADIKDFLSSQDSNISSERGSVVLDSRTNTLLVQDTAVKLQEMREIIVELDIPVRQVLIEARVVVASSNISDEFGVRWGGAGFRDSSRSLDGIAGSVEGRSSLVNDIIDGGTGEVIFPESYVVDLGVNDPNATSMSVGILGKDGLLELELSAIEAEGQAEVISTPKVLTADSQEAEIMSGKKIPIRIATSSGATAVSYIEAVLGLTVTPHITPDNRILMDLELTQDSVASFAVSGDPIIDINQIFTHVLVANGDTIVLGGVFKTTESDQQFKTPFFGDLPIVGRLFRKTTSLNEKQELLVFITPKIVEDLLTN